MPSLVVPDHRFRVSFLAAMAEFAAEGRAGDGSMIGSDLERWGDAWGDDDGFARYVDHLVADALPATPRPADRVACTTLWWVEGVEYVGRLAIRHTLTDHLLQVGGHIGFIRPLPAGSPVE